MRKQVNREAGLTLVEVLIVVAILGVILAIVIPSYAASTKRAQEKLCSSTKIMVDAQIELYQLDTNDIIAADIVDMSTVFGKLTSGGYLRETPICPASGTYSRVDGKLECSKHDADED